MTRARDARWPGALGVLGEVRRTPGVTRAEAARRLGLGSGSATQISARPRSVDPRESGPDPERRPCRPPRSVRPHPSGPLVAVVEVRYDGWLSAPAAIDGRPAPLPAARLLHDSGP